MQKNEITAVNSLAVPVAMYSFEVIDWRRREEIKVMDRKNRKLLTVDDMLHPKSDVDRQYAKRKTVAEDCLS